VREETERILGAYKIAVDDAGRMHVFEPTLNVKDENEQARREKGGADQNLV
jgi:hypothetical protein